MLSLMETSAGVFISDRELELNTEYSFHVVVTNGVRTVQTTQVQIGKCNADKIISESEK